MRYTYDVTDMEEKKRILTNASAQEVRAKFENNLGVSHYALDEILYRGRYKIEYNQRREETEAETFKREWEAAVKRLKRYPYLDRIQIKTQQEE